MGIKGPCKTCERKGCGSYHDECEAYLKWREEYKKAQKPPTQHRDFVKQSAFKSRTNGMFRGHKK